MAGLGNSLNPKDGSFSSHKERVEAKSSASALELTIRSHRRLVVGSLSSLSGLSV